MSTKKSSNKSDVWKNVGLFISQKREEKDMSQSELSRRIGKNRSTVSRYESGEANTPEDVKRKISEVLQFDYFEYPDSPKSSLVPSTSTVPLLGAVVAGEPLETYEEVEDVGIRQEILDRYPKTFALKVLGDSMNKVIPNGSIVYVNPQCNLENGEVGIIRINNTETTMKRFHKLSDGILLEPESWLKDYQSHIYRGNDAKDVFIQGKVVSWSSDPRDFI